jgi:hypothetical protein
MPKLPQDFPAEQYNCQQPPYGFLLPAWQTLPSVQCGPIQQAWHPATSAPLTGTASAEEILPEDHQEPLQTALDLQKLYESHIYACNNDDHKEAQSILLHIQGGEVSRIPMAVNAAPAGKDRTALISMIR